jgi:hypothetical protein
MRIEPPPSEPIAKGETPQATEAPEPADEPPGVITRFQGLRVVAKTGLCPTPL